MLYCVCMSVLHRSPLTFGYVIFFARVFCSVTGLSIQSFCRESRESVLCELQLGHLSPLHVRLPIYGNNVVFSVNVQVGLREKGLTAGMIPRLLARCSFRTCYSLFPHSSIPRVKEFLQQGNSN